MVTFGKIVQIKDTVNGPSKPFTHESVEIWDTEKEAYEALASSSWE